MSEQCLSPDLHESCDATPDCFAPKSRRDFLRDSFLSVAGALIAVGVSRGTALGMPLDFTEARGRSGARRSYGVPATDGAQIDKENQVILVRWAGAVYAFNLSCPHQNTALRWDDRRGEFNCPKHHSIFKPDGAKVEGRAPRAMDRFAVSKDGAAGVSVDLNQLYEQDKDTAQWQAAFVRI
jgi:nitrite reductase/ring-hydroxylating ferredoxin subunit